MQVKEKTAVNCATVKKQNRTLRILLAVLLSVACLAVLISFAVSGIKSGARLAEKEREIAALQQQLDSEKGKNDTLGKENDALKSKVES